MSLQLAAQHLASQGRGPDTTLVHMAPQEVAGLHALAMAHGGKLTTNPDTGLPEAGFLKNILPTLIGAGLTIVSGGTLTPLMAAGLVGGGTALATGSLKKGLMAGLGAYGGAGLGGSLASMGSSAVAPDAIAAANASADPIMAVANAKDAALAAGTTAPTGFSALQAGLQNTMNNPSGFVNAVGGVKPLAQYGLAALSPMMQSEPGPGYQGSGPNPYEYAYDYKTGQYTRLPVGTRDTYTQMPNVPMQRAAGGPVEAMSERNQAETLMANGGVQYAAGGISHLGDYSDGGRLLKGPGDGVSDSIPATIADKRPARLADGEFVVPARIVSELGNGSTDAGARKLYAMMDRVQKARSKTVGKDRVAVNSRAEKLLPA